ncbi:solute carrier organic anion transporter family member 2A1 [Tetranychus urticae]|uniref:Solute carrier organic anion transporter family member n=1 Tax=Tetranychus urticae TaxID=32264 RepID=T1K555_TETUR|nr:solute carrier organic anion transporter family member 2A1 [Tetranychus urticae]
MADLITHLSTTDLSVPRPSVASVSEVTCGFTCWRPRFLRRYANPKIFVAIFSLIATMRSAYFVYMIGVMSTLEKRYAFPSKLSALILIADNISGMVMSPVIGYLGTKFHGPKIIGWGTVLVGLSSIVSGLPYLIYGPATHLLSAETLGIKSSSSLNSTTKYDLCSLSGKPETCQDADRHTFVVGAYALLWAGSFVNGLGNTAFWVVGVPYLDDNVEKKNSPVYFSTTMVIRYSGVALGFLLSSFSLSLYENPTITVNIPRNDPRWVGAWWIGFFIIGFGILLSAIPMFMFPVTMKSNKKQEAKKKMSFTDALATFKRIITNPVLVFDTLGGAMRVIGWAGYYITKTRYIEAQFRQSAAASSFLTGSTSSVLKVIGIFAGGLAISKFRPRPKVLIAYVVFIEMVCNVFILAGIFIGCPAPKFGNIIVDQNTAKASLLNGCNRDCSCTTSVFQPVCGSDGKTNYFSPCYAGCQVSLTNESYSGFSQCLCQSEMDHSVTSGYCDQECNTLPLYLTIIGLAGIISSTAWAGNFIIALRAVDPKDKAFAMGLIGSCMAIFAYIPYPIIFGFVTDAACLVWEESCGETGNCWLYDIDKFRVYLHGTAFTLVMIGSCFDIGVLVYANRLKNLYDDEDDDVQTGKGNHEMSGANGIKAEEEEALFDASQTKSNCNHN